MKKSRRLYKFIGVLVILVLGLTLLNTAAAQGNTSSHGTAAGAYLGIVINNADSGVTVSEVVAGSPAEAAGLQVGDVITSLNGAAVENARAVAETVRGLNVGDTLTIEIARDGETLTLEAVLGQPSGLTWGRGIVLQGIGLRYDGTQWSLETLSEDSPLYAAGLREGDVLKQFNGQPFDLPAVLAYVTGQMTTDEASAAVLTVERDGETVEVELSPDLLMPLLGGGRFGFGRGEQGLIMPPFNFNFGGQPGFNFGGAMLGRAQLGVGFVTLNEETAAANNVAETEGALVLEVLEDSPAAAAGLQVGDIIKRVEGDVVDARRTLRERLFIYNPGESITLDVLRDGELVQLDVTLGGMEIDGLFPFMRRWQGMQPGLPFFFNPPQTQPEASVLPNL